MRMSLKGIRGQNDHDSAPLKRNRHGFAHEFIGKAKRHVVSKRRILNFVERTALRKATRGVGRRKDRERASILCDNLKRHAACERDHDIALSYRDRMHARARRAHQGRKRCKRVIEPSSKRTIHRNLAHAMRERPTRAQARYRCHPS